MLNNTLQTLCGPQTHVTGIPINCWTIVNFFFYLGFEFCLCTFSYSLIQTWSVFQTIARSPTWLGVTNSLLPSSTSEIILEYECWLLMEPNSTKLDHFGLWVPSHIVRYYKCVIHLMSWHCYILSFFSFPTGLGLKNYAHLPVEPLEICQQVYAWLSANVFPTIGRTMYMPPAFTTVMK